MTGLPRGEEHGVWPVTPTLAALREARASRLATMRRRAMPIYVGVVAFLAFSLARAHPRPGLHGTSLVVLLAGCCFVVSIAVLLRLLSAGGGFLFTMPARTLLPRLHPLIVTLLAASSVALEWIQSTGTGVVGLYVIVAVTARTYPRRVSDVLFGACFSYFLACTVAEYTVWNNSRHNLPGFADVAAITALYLMSLFARRIQAHQRHEEQLLAKLEESQAAELRATALAERQRLAREMHDVLAHSLSGLVVQLEGTRMLATAARGDPRLPGSVERAHQLAKSGLEEARQAIAMLRDDELPGPDRIARLAGDFTTDTGVPCRFTQDGEPRELPSPVRLALYRVAQEALTNVRKHAAPDEVDVRLDYRPDAVSLTVQDTGRRNTGGRPDRTQEPGPSLAASFPVSGGYGLTGMRERAGLLGGILDAEPTDTGFVVRLVVPT